MTTFERQNLEDQIISVLDASPSRIPIIVGLDGSGRTSILLNLLGRLSNRASCQYVNVEGTATTPERFWATLTNHLSTKTDLPTWAGQQNLSMPLSQLSNFSIAHDLTTARMSYFY